MPQVSEEKKAEARAAFKRLAPLVIRIGRTYIQCVTVPNRAENADGEQAFADAMHDLVVAFVEMDIV